MKVGSPKDVAHWERAFDLLAGQGTDEVQREGCGQRVGDNLRLTVVTDENRRVALLVAWPVVQRCRHHPSVHLTHDQLHRSKNAKKNKTQRSGSNMRETRGLNRVVKVFPRSQENLHAPC